MLSSIVILIAYFCFSMGYNTPDLQEDYLSEIVLDNPLENS